MFLLIALRGREIVQRYVFLVMGTTLYLEVDRHLHLQEFAITFQQHLDDFVASMNMVELFTCRRTSNGSRTPLARVARTQSPLS